MKQTIKYQNRKVIWRTHTIHVDIKTGEEITRWNAETNYIIIKTDKHVTFNFNKTKAMVEITKQCSKDLRLW